MQDSFFAVEMFLQFLFSNSKNIARAFCDPGHSGGHSDVNKTSLSNQSDGKESSTNRTTISPQVILRPFWHFPLVRLELLILGIATVLPQALHVLQRFTCQLTTFLFHSFISFPLVGIFDSSSLGGHLFLAIITFYIAYRFFRLYLSTKVADRAIVITGLLIWIYLAIVDSIRRSVIVHNSQMHAFQYLLDMQSKGGAAYVASTAAPKRKIALAILDKLSAQLEPKNYNAFENAAWANIALKAFWEVSTVYPSIFQTRFDTVHMAVGGLGRYVSDSILVSLTAMLEDVPPGMGNMRIKSLSLGVSPPLIKGVRVKPLKAADHSGHCTPRRSDDDDGSSRRSSTAAENESSHDQTYTHYGRKTFEKFPNTTSTSPSERFSAKNMIVLVGNKLRRLGDFVRLKFSSIGRAIRSRTAGRRVGYKNTVRNAVAMNDSKEDACEVAVFDRLIIDIDFVFVSKDLDFVATFRYKYMYVYSTVK